MALLAAIPRGGRRTDDGSVGSSALAGGSINLRVSILTLTFIYDSVPTSLALHRNNCVSLRVHNRKALQSVRRSSQGLIHRTEIHCQSAHLHRASRSVMRLIFLAVLSSFIVATASGSSSTTRLSRRSLASLDDKSLRRNKNISQSKRVPAALGLENLVTSTRGGSSTMVKEESSGLPAPVKVRIPPSWQRYAPLLMISSF